MAISDNIRAKADEIHDERLANPKPTDPHPIADDLKSKAIEAILAGGWETFAGVFAKNADELALLVPPSNDKTKREAEAYLVANAMCGYGTGDLLLSNVSTKLDT